MGDFPAPELNDGLDTIALLQEADRVLLFEIVVVIVRIGAELQFLNLDYVLLLAGVMRLLFLLVLIMAEIDGFGDRRNCRWRNQDKVEPKFLRAPQSGGGRHHLGGAVGEHRTDFAHADGLIHILSAILPARRKVSTWIHWLIVFCGMAVTNRVLRGERNRCSLVEKRNGQTLQSSQK